MFGLSWIELFIILIVALLVIGPDKLPEVARGLGRLIRQFQRIVHEVRNSINMDEFESNVRESSHYTPPASRPDSDKDLIINPEEAIAAPPREPSKEKTATPPTASTPPELASFNKSDPTRS